jgi:hypothetical protein
MTWSTHQGGLGEADLSLRREAGVIVFMLMCLEEALSNQRSYLTNDSARRNQSSVDRNAS